MALKLSERQPDSALVEYYHPVCHLINGERLFYILLRANDGMLNVRDDIKRILHRENLSDSACAYVLFGDQDFLVRCWGDDEHIARVTRILKAIPGVSNCVVHLIDRIHTWYQLRMRYESERRHYLVYENHASESAGDGPLPFTPTFVLDTETRDKLLARSKEFLGLNRRHKNAVMPPPVAENFPAHSTTSLSGQDFHCRVLRSDNNIRFFIFGKTSASEGRELFRLLQEKLDPAHSDAFRSSVEDPLRDLLARFCNVSLYTFRERRKMGLILKAEIGNTNDWSKQVLSLSNAMKDYGIEESTTYICAEPIEEEHSLRSYEEVLPTNPRKFYIVQGLLMTQDCRPSDMDPQRNRGRAYRASRFTEIVYQNYFNLLQPGPFWQDYLDDLRYLYRMVAFHEEEKLLAFIMRKFASIEHEICRSLEDEYKNYCKSRYERRLESLQSKIESYIKAQSASKKTDAISSPDAPFPKHIENIHDASVELKRAFDSKKLNVVDFIQLVVEAYVNAQTTEKHFDHIDPAHASLPKHIADILKASTELSKVSKPDSPTMSDFTRLVNDSKAGLIELSKDYKKTRTEIEKEQPPIDKPLEEMQRVTEHIDSFLKLLDNFETALEKARDCRNEVMHGRASNMFATTESGEAYVFEKFIEAIIELSLTYKPAIRLLSGTVLGDIQNRFEKKKDVLKKAINAAKQADPATEVQPRKSPMPK